ncbi:MULTISPECIES: hypothetical protein [unclassified Kribbella]|uniref:hypothetical protein n=1 Tax=unclassified Kribbella TaxID=2644121 RepID=UPI003409308D|nr:hypothetical protein OG817_39885 [Kribbella sp. NBC_00889]
MDATGEKFLKPYPPGFKITDRELNLSTEHPAAGMPDPKTCLRASTWNWLP